MYLALSKEKESTGKFIESVTYHLHPTFHPKDITLNQFPFLISRIGWGYFNILIDIVFKKWTGIPKMKL